MWNDHFVSQAEAQFFLLAPLESVSLDRLVIIIIIFYPCQHSLFFNVLILIVLPIANFVAVGTMEPHIDIWDLDLVDTLEPVVSLGRREKKKSKQVRGQILKNILK